MKYKKIFACMIAGVVCMGMLTGCVRLPWDFRSSEEAQEYVLSKLQRRYHETFVFVEEPTYKEEEIGLRWIRGMVAPEAHPEQKATVYARNTARYEDTYHAYLYEDRLLDLARPMFEGKDQIEQITFAVRGRSTGEKWTGEEPLEEYLNRGEYDILVDVYLYEGGADEDYVEQICDLIRTIEDCGLHIQLDVWDAPEEWIFRAYADDGALAEQPEKVLDLIQTHRSLRESRENYEVWKAEQGGESRDNP